MGYLLRGLRVASYLAAALGLLLIFGAIINNALFFFGIRFLFIGVVGIGATSLLRDSFLEGEEEEEYNSLLPTPQLKIPPIPQPKTLHLPQPEPLKFPEANIPKLKSKDVIGGISRYIPGFIGIFAGSTSGFISGFIGVVMGGFVYTVILEIQSESYESTWGYFFWIITCLGYPLIGAFLGALSGIMVSFMFFKLIGENILYPMLSVIVSLLFGFLIGVLVGIAPYIAVFLYGEQIFG